MKILLEISDSKSKKNNFSVREAARAVLFDDQNLTPLLYVSKFNYHKIPGGGIEKGENMLKALERECLEETGCSIKVEGELGEITEERSGFKLFQISYCFIGKVISKGNPKNFTKKEKEQGFILEWHPLAEAIEIIKNEKPLNYEGGFIQKRDLRFLEEARSVNQF